MPWGRAQAPVFEPFKSKTYLKCAVARIKQAKAKKTNEAKVYAKEVGQCLVDGKEVMARIKVEHVIRTKNCTHALEIVELFCDLLLARHMLLESEDLLPVELQESVFSLCWAATRTEISELAQAKSQFMLKFKEVRTQFGTPLQGEPQPAETSYVNKKLIQYLNCATPERKLVLGYLTEIGSIYAPDWTPSAELEEPENPDLITFPDVPLQFEPGGAASVVVDGPPRGERDAITVTFFQELLGLELRGIDPSGAECQNPDAPCAYVMVSNVRPQSEASTLPLVTRGQVLIAIQGHGVQGLSFNQTTAAIREAGRPVSFLLSAPPLSAASTFPPAYTAGVIDAHVVPQNQPQPQAGGSSVSAPGYSGQTIDMASPTVTAVDDLEARLLALKKQ